MEENKIKQKLNEGRESFLNYLVRLPINKNLTLLGLIYAVYCAPMFFDRITNLFPKESVDKLNELGYDLLFNFDFRLALKPPTGGRE